MKIPYEMRCNFIKTTKSCDYFLGVTNYLKFVECSKKDTSRIDEILSCCGLAVLFFYLVLFVAIVADRFYSPALKATAKKMHMSEHLAGVTLLAVGNSTSDFMGQMQSTHIDQVFTYMMANAILVTLISGGLVCYLWPTQLPKYETVRTLLFFMLGAVSVEYMYTTDSSISAIECSLIIFLYIVYLIIEIIEGYIEKVADRGIVILESRMQYSHAPRSPRSTSIRRSSTSFSSKEKERNTINTQATRMVDYRVANPKNELLLEGFVETIQPIEEEYWRNSGYAVRVALLILAPLVFFCKLLMPIVNLESRRHGWSKLLNCIQIVITPLFVTGVVSMRFSLVMCFQLLITVPVALAVFKNSRTDLPPPYHFGFVILSYVGSILLLYICTNEMNEILNVVGLVFGLSAEFIASTISCWGSSMCTIVINCVLAQHGYGAMAIAASYAGPYFSFIMAMGFVPAYRHVLGTYSGSANGFYLVAYVFLIISLSSSLIWSLLFNFYGRRSVGIYNFIIYMLYIIYCALCEMELIHSYALDSEIKIV
ncbi:mitochondrial sodium/calcium exchanger protein-like [Drosophila nasuta]|uniref:mitochondrial sodium/calcium exchanger protein-like n=1 Tax=Drosophila nasuta TaxID=42062 RepID=UPI00295E9E7F|nr:mitochondrial sodium/calcium exchanger protein-like [Drosophila nasuta]